MEAYFQPCLEVTELFMMYLTVGSPLLYIKLIYDDVFIKSSMWSNDPPVLDHKSVHTASCSRKMNNSFRRGSAKWGQPTREQFRDS